MDGIEQLVSQAISMANRLDGGLWLMEERALAKHLTRPRAQAGEPRMISPLSLVEARGSVAVIAVHGVMMKDPWFDDETSTSAIEEATRTVGDDPQFAAILYDIDSPGGSSAGIAGLADAVAVAGSRKTIVAQSRGMIASGAYWLASGAQKIYAEKMDWIGSIGVRMDVFDVSRYFANLGIERVAIDTGPLKSCGLFGTEVTQEQRDYIRELVNDTHSHFKSQVQQGRKFNDGQFTAVATGGVFPASTALRLGLIDGIQTFSETLAGLPRQKTSTQRSTTMADQAATLPELKKALPGATSEFIVEQLEAGATVESASRAYNALLSAENAKLKQRIEEEDKKKEEAEEQKKKEEEEAEEKKKKDEEAKARALKSGGRGNKLQPAASVPAEAGGGDVDFIQMARDYQEKHNCRWAVACLEIKHKYPESRAVFGAPEKVSA